jgi:hypothetical protein
MLVACLSLPFAAVAELGGVSGANPTIERAPFASAFAVVLESALVSVPVVVQ